MVSGDSGSNENPKDTVAFTYAREQPDVCVHTPVTKYLVHSQVLKLGSPWFAASMSETWWDEQRKSKSGAAGGSSFKYNYYFNTDKDGIHMLLSVDKRSTSSAGQSTLDAECAALGNIFRAFYHKRLVFETPIKSKTLLYLIETAEKYDALEICTLPILGAMFEIENLDTEVSLHSASYLLIGYKLKSTLLFRDAFIHVVGQWHVDRFRHNQNHPTFPEPVRKLVEAENARLMEMTTSTMRLLLSVETEIRTGPIKCELGKVLVFLMTNEACITFPNAGDEGSLFNRINCCFMPSASLYQQSIHYAFCPPRYENGRQLECGAHLQNDIVSNKENLRRQTTSFLTSTVRALVKNNTRLKIQQRYLTCAELSDDKMPWLE